MESDLSTNPTPRVKKLREFIEEKFLKGMQTFNCLSMVPDSKSSIYNEDNIEVLICRDWGYLEILGLDEAEYSSLADILYIC